MTMPVQFAYLMQKSIAVAQLIRLFAKRSFSADGLTLIGFVIEGADGNRKFVFACVELATLDAAARDWIRQGMNTLIHERRTTVIGVKACGFTPMLMLDSIQ